VRRRGRLFSKRWDELTVGGWNRTKLVEGVEAQMAMVRRVLDSKQMYEVPVRGALCFVGGDLPTFGHLGIRNVRIDGCLRIAKLARRPGPLDAADVASVAAELEQSLTPA
jgi:hypothetical protein